ncbi:MAG: condensation domain-containing protein [Caldilineaceae bacterium]
MSCWPRYAKALDAYQHQDLPFEQLVDALARWNAPSADPLFQAMLVLQNTQPGTSTGSVQAILDLFVSRHLPTRRFPFAKFDLTFKPAGTGQRSRLRA